MRKIGVLFPGQGSQFEGMGSEYLGEDIYKLFKDMGDDGKIDSNLVDTVLKACPKDLSLTKNAQIAIFLYSLQSYINALDNIEAMGKIVAMTGLSLGEYTSLVASGMIDISDGIEMVVKRGQIMSNGAGGAGTMVAVMKSSKEVIEELIDKTLCELSEKNIKSESKIVEGSKILDNKAQDLEEKYILDIESTGIEDNITIDNKYCLSISNLNSPAQIVVGGDFDSIDAFEKNCKDAGIKKVVRLDVEGPFHTEILKDCAEEFSSVLKKTDINRSDIEVYSNVKGVKYSEIMSLPNSKEVLIDNLKKQMYSTVYFEQCIRNMIEDGIDLFVEIGPGKALSSFIKKIDKDVEVIHI